MADMARYDIYGVKIGATTIGGITQANLQTGTEIRGDPTSGAVYILEQSIVAQKPSASFTTLALIAAFDIVGSTGVMIDENGLSLYGYKHAAGGTRAEDLSHRKYLINNGLIVPRTLSASQQDDANLSCDVLIIHDGSANDPIILSEDVTLPTITDLIRYGMGPVTIESIELISTRSWTIDFGIEAETIGAYSNIWDTYVSILTIKPVLTLRGINLEWWKDSGGIPLGGKAVTHLNTKLYLRARESGGSFVADATTEHISITAAGMAYVTTGLDGDGRSPAEVEIVIPLYYDGSDDPLVISRNVAIT